jgi:hypothetical protein
MTKVTRMESGYGLSAGDESMYRIDRNRFKDRNLFNKRKVISSSDIYVLSWNSR